MWIEIEIVQLEGKAAVMSRLARALWIEIGTIREVVGYCLVEARESLVD